MGDQIKIEDGIAAAISVIETEMNIDGTRNAYPGRAVRARCRKRYTLSKNIVLIKIN